MNYEEFKEKLSEDLKENLFQRGYEEVDVSFTNTKKANLDYESMAIKPVHSNVGINLNVESIYAQYDKGVEYSEILKGITAQSVEALDNIPSIDVDSFTDYDEMKNKLTVEVIAKEGNEEFLKNIPHKDLEDMAIVYRFVLGNDEQIGRSSITVTNSMLENYGVTLEQLHQDAITNAPKFRPPVIKGMTEVIREMMGQEMFDMVGQSMQPGGTEAVYVASTEDNVNGAGIIAYPEFLQEAADQLDSSFFILPSSRHEVLLVIDDGIANYKDLELMVEQVNATEVRPEDKLTDNVYHYDRDAEIFELASSYDARINAQEHEEDIGDGDKSSVLKDLGDKKKEVADRPEKAVDKAIKKPEKSKGGEAI